MGKSTVGKAAHEDLNVRSCTRTPKQLVSTRAKQWRLKRREITEASWLKSKKNSGQIFAVGEVWNHWDDKFLEDGREENSRVDMTEHLQQVMGLRAVGSDGPKNR